MGLAPAFPAPKPRRITPPTPRAQALRGRRSRSIHLVIRPPLSQRALATFLFEQCPSYRVRSTAPPLPHGHLHRHRARPPGAGANTRVVTKP
jgi:hypothetical protein